MRRKLLVGLLGMGSLACAPSWGGDAEGVVKQVHMGPVYGPNVFLLIEGNFSNQPSCQGSNTFQFAFDSSTPAGKATLAAVLAAKSSGAIVTISGNNQCTLFYNVEDLRWFTVE